MNYIITDNAAKISRELFRLGSPSYQYTKVYFEGGESKDVYFIEDPEDNLVALEVRGSKELIILDEPEKNNLPLLFDVIVHPISGKKAMVVDLDYNLSISSEKDLTILKNLVTNLTQTEIEGMVEMIESLGEGEIRFGNLINNVVDVKEESFMLTNGWEL